LRDFPPPIQFSANTKTPKRTDREENLFRRRKKKREAFAQKNDTSNGCAIALDLQGKGRRARLGKKNWRRARTLHLKKQLIEEKEGREGGAGRRSRARRRNCEGPAVEPKRCLC